MNGQIAGFIVTLGQGKYAPIVRGLLPEVLKQNKLSPEEVDSVLKNWKKFIKDSHEEIQLSVISELLQRGIGLAPWSWLIALGVGLGLTAIGTLANRILEDVSTSISKSPVPICKKLNNYVPVAEVLELQDDYSPNFNGGKLTVKFTANGTPDDCLVLRNYGQNSEEIGINGNSITYRGNVIGNVESGKGIEGLVVSFNEQSTREAVQAVARRVVYSLDISENPSYGDRRVEFQVTDGDGGDSIKNGGFTQTIQVVNKNNPIAINLPSPQTVKENTNLPIDSISINASNSQKVIVTLEVKNGNLSVKEDVVNGLTTDDIANNQTSRVTMTGTVAQVNTTLTNTDALIYKGNQQFSGTDSLTIIVNENRSEEKNTVIWPPNARKSQIVSKTIDIQIESANPAPVIKVPSLQLINENEKLAISGISISDFNNKNMTLTLEVNKGKLILNTNVPGGLTSDNIKDNQTNKVTLNGSIEAINNILVGTNNLIYQSNDNYRGKDNLTVTANDGDKTTTKRVLITVNDNPTLSIPEFVTTSSGVKITKPEAINLIFSWLKAKQKVFAYPFNSKILEQYTTGKYLSERIGTIQWLRRNNAKYTYKSFKIQSQGQFFIKDDQVNIDIKVSEDRTLVIQDQVDFSSTGDNTSIYRWTLQLEDDLWKIADSKEIN